jgi:hypothetical protein
LSNFYLIFATHLEIEFTRSYDVRS